MMGMPGGRVSTSTFLHISARNCPLSVCSVHIMFCFCSRVCLVQKGVLDQGYVRVRDERRIIILLSNQMSFYNLMMTTHFQGDLGEPGPKGRDGPKVRMHLIMIPDH